MMFLNLYNKNKKLQRKNKKKCKRAKSYQFKITIKKKKFKKIFKLFILTISMCHFIKLTKNNS